MNASIKNAIDEPWKFVLCSKGGVVCGDKSTQIKNLVIHRDILQSKLQTKRRRFKSRLNFKTNQSNQFSGVTSVQTITRQEGNKPKTLDNRSYASTQSDATRAKSPQSKAILNTTTNEQSAGIKTVALTSFVSFVCGAILSLLFLIYTQLDILSTATNNASWQNTFPLGLLLTVVLVYFLGGTLKGLAGLGMALIAVPVIGLLYDPVLAATIVAIPLIVSNVRQGLFSGRLKYTLSNYNPFIITMSVAMVPTVYFSSLLPVSYISVLLGSVAIMYALMNMGFRLPAIPDSKDHTAQIIFGAAAGVAGGLSGLIAIPLAFYVFSRNLEKDIAVSVMGLAFLISGVALLVGHASNGNFTQELLLLSAIATIPGLVGTLSGEMLRNYISTAIFRKIVLLVVLFIGIKILISQ